MLAGPAFVELSVGLLGAHVITYWLSQDSNITPPVCLAAYVGAPIARADPWRSGRAAFKIAKLSYVVPLLFASTPILMDGPVDVVILSRVSATLGTIAFGALTIRVLQRITTLLEWLILAGATLLNYRPGYVTDALGIALIIGLWLLQTRFELSVRRGIRALGPRAARPDSKTTLSPHRDAGEAHSSGCSSG